MNIKPLGNRLLIKPIVEEKKTESGIVLPDSAKEKPQSALVIEVGNLDEDYDINKGDKVIFSKFAGTEIKVNDEDHIIIDVEDILAKVEE